MGLNNLSLNTHNRKTTSFKSLHNRFNTPTLNSIERSKNNCNILKILTFSYICYLSSKLASSKGILSLTTYKPPAPPDLVTIQFPSMSVKVKNTFLRVKRTYKYPFNLFAFFLSFLIADHLNLME